MNFGPYILLSLAVVAGIFVTTRVFSPEARERRRRQRSYRRPVPTVNRPMVKLTAKVPKDKK